MAKKKLTISGFFYRLVKYGGISTDPGILYLWSDPDLLIPYNSFAALQNFLIKKIGKEGEKIFLWMGRISGYQSSIVLQNKFGVPFTKIWNDNHDDMDNLINGATQDGFGFIKARDYPVKNKPVKFSLEGKDCIIGKSYLKLFGTQKNAVDYFIAGIILGGGEFLFKRPLSIKESKCIAKGQNFCVFELKEGNQTKSFSTLFKKTGLNQKIIEDKMHKVYLQRSQKGNFVKSKQILFGDGKFIYSGIRGVLVATRVFVPGMEIIKNIVNKKVFEKLLKEFSQGYAEEVNNVVKLRTKDLSNHNLKKVMNVLTLFGFGKFDLLRKHKEAIYIENKNNPFVRDFVNIFGIKKEPFDDIISSIIKTTLEKVYSTNFSVQEVECVALGDRRCLFKVTKV